MSRFNNSFPSCLSSLSKTAKTHLPHLIPLAGINTMTKGNLGEEEGSFLPLLPDHNPSLREVRVRTKAEAMEG